MKISHSSIDFASQRTFQRSETRITKENIQPRTHIDPEGQASAQLKALSKTTNRLQHSGLTKITSQNPSPIDYIKTDGYSDPEESSYDKKLFLTKLILESLTGKKIKTGHPSETQHESEKQIQLGDNEISIENSQALDLDVSVEINQTISEQETTTVKSSGSIHTENEQEIQFSMQLLMHNDFFESDTFVLSGKQASDPLVLNFDGTTAGLSDETFEFDLNNDGQTENIHTLIPGKGFLVLDRNQNGQIDNGTELFGPQTGNGFLELSAYDEDQNHWIDENDSIFNKLEIWETPQDNYANIYSLTEKGVGAIYLDAVDSVFQIKTQINDPKGIIKSTGLFVTEQGLVKPISQIDLVV